MTGQIRGVIGIGAARPAEQYQITKKSDLLYAGLVGNRDMNYQSHLMLAQKLNKLGMNNLLVISTKTHQWAPVEESPSCIDHACLHTGDKKRTLLVDKLGGVQCRVLFPV